MFDYDITRKHQAYSEFREFTDNRRARLLQASGVSATIEAPTASKEQYLKQKQSAADARKRASRLSKLQKEMSALEEELILTEEKMQGEAATDYKLLAELDSRKNEIEERLMEIYEELEELQAE